MPNYIYGFIYKYKDYILIAINNRISFYKQQITFLHELAHLELNHINKKCLYFKLENIEDEADRYVQNILKKVRKNNYEN